MTKHSKFDLDVLASADLGQDTFEGPHQDRDDVSIASILRAGEGVAVLVDIPGVGSMELPLPIDRQLAEALTALLGDLDG